MVSPFVSVVVPTRNRPHDLANCLDALSHQSLRFVAYEVIIVDDHSNTTCISQYQQLLHQHSEMNVRFYSLPGQQTGTVHARNLGLEHASGEIIGFLDDDSIPYADWLSVIISCFSLNLNITAITGPVTAVDEIHPLSVFRQNFYDIRYKQLLCRESTESIKSRFNLTEFNLPNGFYMADYLAGGNSAIRASTLDIHGTFDRCFQMMHDKEIALRLLQNRCICVFVPNLVVRHNHTKSVFDAMSKSFRSGKYNYRLHARYPTATSLRPVLGFKKPLKPLKSTIQLTNKLGWKLFPLIPLVFSLEYLHQFGYVLEKYTHKFNTGECGQQYQSDIISPRQ